MGVFDFFKRRANGLQPGEAEQLAEQFGQQPRQHHYTLAHIALRSVFLENPFQVLGVLASEHARDFLDSLWESVCEACADEQPDFTPADLQVRCVRLGNYPCAIIEMPPPRAITEAHFVAMVLLVDVAQPPPDPESCPKRYFTLEQGASLDGTPRTVFGEWTETTHLNCGDGPPPNVNDFMAEVKKAVE